MLLEIKDQNDFEGSRLFVGLSNSTGIALDKVILIILLFFLILFSFFKILFKLFKKNFF